MRSRVGADIVSIAIPLAIASATMGVPAAHAKVPGVQGRVAFARFDDALQDDVTYTANADGTDVRQLYPGASNSPHWSPDGQLVAVSACADPPICDTAAVIVNPDTGTARVLAMPDPADVFTNCAIWSPDGTKLACEGDGQNDSSLNGIYTISTADGGNLTRVTSNNGGTDSPLDYSPDGSRLVIGRTDPSRPARANQALFVVSSDGAHQQRITPWGFSDNQASWSPDGSLIAFEHSGNLFTVHPDGTGLAKLPLAVSGNYFAGDASWSPDGTRILFLLGSNTRTEGIASANRDGSDVRQVTVSPTKDHMGDWGPHRS